MSRGLTTDFESTSRGPMPDIGNIIDSFKNFLFAPLEIAKVAAKGFVKLLGIIWDLLIDWIVDAVPTKNWKRADKWVASLTLIIFASTYVARMALKGVGWADSFASVSMTAERAAETYTTALLFRCFWGVVGPWIGGLLALFMVFPEFLLNLVLGLPELIFNTIVAIFNWIIDVINEMVKQLVKAIADFIKTFVKELIKPITYLIDLVKNLSF